MKHDEKTLSKYPWLKFEKNNGQTAYRVVWYIASAQPGMNGWSSHVRTFATANEAIEQVAAKMGIAFKVIAQRLEPNKWAMLAERKRLKEIKLY